MSKKLDSILSKVPPATAPKSEPSINVVNPSRVGEGKDNPPNREARITAVIPYQLKKEIKELLENNPTETEKSLILKGMKAIGFTVNDEWLADKRRLR